MNQFKKIDMNEIWQKEQGWNTEKKSGRKYDDQKELAFWDQLAPHYSVQFNLYRDVKGLGDWLHQKFGEGQRILDLGCGTGNFTLPMATYSKEILALDFSPAMLQVLSHNLKQRNIQNVKTALCKWEDYEGAYPADYVLSVNSLYRVCYMQEALSKIVTYGKKGFVIVRTVLKPLLYDIYDELHLNYHRNNDYMLMPMMLWNMGIHADVTYTHYDRTTTYANWHAVEKQMIEDLGELSYLNYSNQLEDHFLAKAVKTDKGYTFTSKRIVVVISCFNGK